MSLTANTTVNTDQPNSNQDLSGIVILENRPTPSNYTDVVNAITRRFTTKLQMHLLHKDFNLPATNDHENTKMAQLFALRQRQYNQPGNDVNDDQPPSYPITTAPRTKTTATLTYNHGDTPVVLFADPLGPMPAGPETTEARHLRMNAWKFLGATCYFHPHLLHGLRIGDIHGLWRAIKAATLKPVVSTIMGITAFTHPLPGSLNGAAYERHVNHLKESIKLKTSAEHMYAFTALLVVHGISNNPDFKPAPAIISSGNSDQLTIFHQPMTSNRTKAGKLTANHTETGRLPPDPSGDPNFPEICKTFKRDGRCKFEEHRQNGCRHSHGTENDKIRLAVRASKLQSTKKPQAQLSCYRCGSKHHSIDNCSEPDAKVRPDAATPSTSLTTLDNSTITNELQKSMDALTTALNQHTQAYQAPSNTSTQAMARHPPAQFC
jgi:hypothetical protein